MSTVDPSPGQRSLDCPWAEAAGEYTQFWVVLPPMSHMRTQDLFICDKMSGEHMSTPGSRSYPRSDQGQHSNSKMSTSAQAGFGEGPLA